MQPYLYPYAGYFRLMAAAETFVIFDDVQFPRRGRIHRCEVPGPLGATEWLTLPLARQSRDVRIKDLAFASRARESLDKRLARLRWLTSARACLAEQVRSHLFGPLDSPVAFLEAGLAVVAEALTLPAQRILGSSLRLDPTLRGQDRVIALVQAVGGRVYVNAPGGRGLYDPEAFRRGGLELRFLEPYAGPFRSMLSALVTHDPEVLREDIIRTAIIAEDAAAS